MGSFNLHEPATSCEPQTLNEEIISETVLKYLRIDSYRIAYKDNLDTYKNLRNNNLIDNPSKNIPAILWVRGRKI